VQFSRELRDGVTSGKITVSFRLWQRPQVRVAGRYSVGSAQIEIDSIEVMPFRAVTADDVRRSGERDRESLRGQPMPARSRRTPCYTGSNSMSSGSEHNKVPAGRPISMLIVPVAALPSEDLLRRYPATRG